MYTYTTVSNYQGADLFGQPLLYILLNLTLIHSFIL